MKIRILDRILVAVAGLMLIAGCAGVVAQVFFGKDVIGFASKLLTPETSTGKILVGICAAILLILGLYCVLMLFRHRRRRDKFVLQRLESGELAISLKTLETMVQKCVNQHQEIKTEGIRLENQRDGLLIRIRGTVAGGISIPLTVDTLQKQVKQYVTACSGVEVKGIRIQIESSGEDAKDAPFAIEPPGNNLLPKGGETEGAGTGEHSGPEETAEKPDDLPPEMPAEPEKTVPAEETAFAAAAMAAAENMMDDLDPDDDRPIHQRLFSVQEEPCIMPLPPENTENREEEKNEPSDAPGETEPAAEPAAAEETPAESGTENEAEEETHEEAAGFDAEG